MLQERVNHPVDHHQLVPLTGQELREGAGVVEEGVDRRREDVTRGNTRQVGGEHVVVGAAEIVDVDVVPLPGGHRVGGHAVPPAAERAPRHRVAQPVAAVGQQQAADSRRVPHLVAQP